CLFEDGHCAPRFYLAANGLVSVFDCGAGAATCSDHSPDAVHEEGCGGHRRTVPATEEDACDGRVDRFARSLRLDHAQDGVLAQTLNEWFVVVTSALGSAAGVHPQLDNRIGQIDVNFDRALP